MSLIGVVGVTVAVVLAVVWLALLDHDDLA